MVHARELDFADELFVCPVCGSQLSLLKMFHEETGELVILVTCEMCEEYHGFAVFTGLEPDDLAEFTRYRKKAVEARVEGYTWGDEEEPVI